MFDNLRDSMDSPLYEDEQNNLYKDADPQLEEAPIQQPRKKRRAPRGFLGMTAQQRFILSLMLMLIVLILGTLAMLMLGVMSIF